MIRLGAHLSMAGGLVQAAQNMIAMGGNALQIFSGSPRGWARKSLGEVKTQPFVDFCREHDFGPVFVHALYLVNLASDNPVLLQNSVKGIIYDLAFSSAIHGGGVVVHLGSHLGKGFDAVKGALVDRMTEILQSTPDDSVFLIENSAGQNGKIASDFAEIRYLLDTVSGRGISPKRMGWCFDTCHAHAAGYDLDTVEAEITKYHLWDSLKVIHLNDSRDPFDSGRDRHDNIGSGVIGQEKIQRFVRDQKFQKHPFILEVPGFDKQGPDKKNIDIVKEMLR